MVRLVLVVLTALLWTLAGSNVASAAAIVSGFNANELARNDDSSAGPVPIGFSVNLFGTTFSNLFVNNNGNVTFDSRLSTFTPFPLLGTDRLIVAPFFADVDTRNAGDPVTYGTGSFGGRPAFGVNWINVDYFLSSPNHTARNSFQLILVNRSDRANGDFDIVFNYDRIQWETGEASGGDSSGRGGFSARAGYAIGRGAPGSAFELAGSAVNGAFLDNTAGSLIRGSRNSTVPGRYVFEIRGGDANVQVGALTPFGNGPSLASATSGNGRFVVFQTRATNLAANSPSGVTHILRVDTLTGQIARISVDNAGAAIAGDAIEPAISGDGDLIAFVAPDAAVGKLYGESATKRAQRLKGSGAAVFLRNMATGTTHRVGDASSQGQGTLPQISPGAAAIVLTRENLSGAEGVVGQRNVYYVPLSQSGDMVTPGQPQCVSCKAVNSQGTNTSTNSNGHSGSPSVSGDGQWVAFETAARNLIVGSASPCANASTEVMVRNTATGVLRRASAPASGGSCGAANAGSSGPKLDNAGLRLVFTSTQPLASGDTDSNSDVYAFDLAGSAPSRVSKTAAGGNGNGASNQPAISGDGRFVAFVSSATNLDASATDSNSAADVHVAEIATGSVRRLSTTESGQQANGASNRPSLDYAGLRISFDSDAGNLAPGAVSGQLGVFQRANPLAADGPPVRSATWWNPSESGWGLFTIDQGNLLATGWFTYDTDGEPTWFLLVPSGVDPDGTYRGEVQRYTGVPFDRTSGNAAEAFARVGDAELRFSGERALNFRYTVGNTTQSKTLTRFPFGDRELVCSPSGASRASASNFSDLWWSGSGASSGWGLHISHIGNSLFATWYTYDSDREGVFMIAATTRQNDGSFSGPLLRQPNGTPFLQINGAPAAGNPSQVGTAVLRFSDGQTGSFETSLGGVMQTKAIARLQFGSASSVCQDVPLAPTAR